MLPQIKIIDLYAWMIIFWPYLCTQVGPFGERGCVVPNFTIFSLPNYLKSKAKNKNKQFSRFWGPFTPTKRGKSNRFTLFCWGGGGALTRTPEPLGSTGLTRKLYQSLSSKNILFVIDIDANEYPLDQDGRELEANCDTKEKVRTIRRRYILLF